MKNYFLHLNQYCDSLSILMLTLIIYVGGCILGFSYRYMKGDSHYGSFIFRLLILIILLSTNLITDNLIVFFVSLFCSHMVLVTLMIHKSKWKAAYASGLMALKNYLISSILMGLAFVLFYKNTESTQISSLVNIDDHSLSFKVALGLLFFSIMAQSGVWPFHKWLISSLNSPTPVSAMMHAGIINGGGFLLARFCHLYARYEWMMTSIFILGIISVLIGTLCKLIQNNVKKMLACSTMAQMGFMLAQCGLGLFSFAIAHLFWHGLFKAYLFLTSSSSAQEHRLKTFSRWNLISFVVSFILGLIGTFVIGFLTDKSWCWKDTTSVLMIIVCLTMTQIAFSIISKPNFKNFLYAFLGVIISAVMYGLSSYLILRTLESMDLMHPQKLNIIHILGTVLLIFGWFFMLTIHTKVEICNQPSPLMLKLYVKFLNFSQSSKKTITAHRNHYQY